MRKVDYMGSQPVASKLLFAPPEPGSEGNSDGDFSAIQMAQDPPGRMGRPEFAREGSDGGAGDALASTA